MSVSYFRLMLLFLLVLTLTIFPIPVGYEIFRPLWALIFLLYIQFKLPDLFSYLWVIVLGLILDVFSVVPLGEHIFALCLVVGVASSRARRFKFFSPIQQMIWIFFLTLLYQTTQVVIDYICGHPVMLIRFILPPVISTLIWPFFVTLTENYVPYSKTRSNHCL